MKERLCCILNSVALRTDEDMKTKSFEGILQQLTDLAMLWLRDEVESLKLER